jgi:hypothetical protein
MNWRVGAAAAAVVVVLIAGAAVVLVSRGDEGIAKGPTGPRSGQPPVDGQTQPATTEPDALAADVATTLEGAPAPDVAAIEAFLGSDQGEALSASMAALAQLEATDLGDCGSVPEPVAGARMGAFLQAASEIPDPVLNEAALSASMAAEGLALHCGGATVVDPDNDPSVSLRLSAAVYAARLEQAGLRP